MADKNRELAEAVIAAVGGASNITSVTHCMTRLRFVLKDQSIPKKEEVERIKGVMGTNIAGGQYQIIIGNSVGSIYREVVAATGIGDTPGSGDDGEKKKLNPVITALDFISGCMAPLFPAIIAGGLIKVLLVIFGPTLLGVMSDTSDTYILMNALGDAPFYFLPVIVAFTASRKLNCNSYLAVMVASVLIYPDVITLLGGESSTYLFGVIPVTHGSYSSSIIPAMLSTILLKYVEILGGPVHPGRVKEFLKTTNHCGDYSANYTLPVGTSGNYGRKWSTVCYQQRVWICAMAGIAYFRRTYAVYRYDGDALGIRACMSAGACRSGI